MLEINETVLLMVCTENKQHYTNKKQYKMLDSMSVKQPSRHSAQPVAPSSPHPEKPLHFATTNNSKCVEKCVVILINCTKPGGEAFYYIFKQSFK